MALKFIDYNSPEYIQMVALRDQILRKPLGLQFTKEHLAKDINDTLLGCFDEDALQGCCLLTKIDDSTVRLRQMAVLDGLQGKGVGRVLMNFAENVARDAGYKKIWMNVRETAIGFYSKLGYKVCSDMFEEVTIPHYRMEKYLL
jgi:GNAT superfamily N-acetyltransferase